MAEQPTYRCGAFACNCLAIRWNEADAAAREIAQSGQHPTAKAIRLKFNADAANVACNKVCTPDLQAVAGEACLKHCATCATKGSKPA